MEIVNQHRAFGGTQYFCRHEDAAKLLKDSTYAGEILVDQGIEDKFLEQQLQPEYWRLPRCQQAGKSRCACSRVMTIAIISSARSSRTTWRSMPRSSPAQIADYSKKIKTLPRNPRRKSGSVSV